MSGVLTSAPASDASVDPLSRRAPTDLPCQIHDAGLWFAEDPADLETAKILCTCCPARAGCLLGALHRREPTGVWGGQIFKNGVILDFKRPRGRPRKRAEAPAPSDALSA